MFPVLWLIGLPTRSPVALANLSGITNCMGKELALPKHPSTGILYLQAIGDLIIEQCPPDKRTLIMGLFCLTGEVKLSN